MLELHDIPDDLPTCQQMLKDVVAADARLQQIHEELLATCTSIQDSQQKLEQKRPSSN